MIKESRLIELTPPKKMTRVIKDNDMTIGATLQVNVTNKLVIEKFLPPIHSPPYKA